MAGLLEECEFLVPQLAQAPGRAQSRRSGANDQYLGNIHREGDYKVHLSQAGLVRSAERALVLELALVHHPHIWSIPAKMG
jgi:hypothetical protein